MNAADILSAVRQAGAALRVEGDSLVASNASRIAPDLKAAIRQNKPQIITALVGSGCKVTIIEIPATGLRYRRTFARLQLKPPALVEVERWRQCVKDGSKFLALWGEQAETLGWTPVDLFGLHAVPDRPHPSYQRLSRYDCTGLVWLLQGRPVVAFTEDTATIQNPKTGNVTVYRKQNTGPRFALVAKCLIAASCFFRSTGPIPRRSSWRMNSFNRPDVNALESDRWAFSMGKTASFAGHNRGLGYSMAAHDSDVVLSAFTEDHVERLTGISKRQLRYWDRTGFFVPSLAYHDRRDSYSRLYTFRDLVCLKIVNVLRNEANVSLPHLREVKEKLAHLGDDMWAKTTLFVLNRRVVFYNPETANREDVLTGQGVLQIPLIVVSGDMANAVRALWQRDGSTVGKIERQRNVVQNQAVIAGTRIPVRSVKAFADAGYSIEQIKREYPTLTDEDIRAAINYDTAA